MSRLSNMTGAVFRAQGRSGDLTWEPRASRLGLRKPSGLAALCESAMEPRAPWDGDGLVSEGDDGV